MSQLTENDYRRLKALLRFYFDRIAPKIEIPLEDHPIAVLERFEAKSMARARRGLEMTINDIVEMTDDWHPKKIVEIDRELISQGAMSLTEARQRYSRKYARALKRGRIVSDEEYYLLKGVVDGGAVQVGSLEFGIINAMLSTYEGEILSTSKSDFRKS